MSETEHKKGRLKPLVLNGDIENTARILLDGMKVEPNDYYDSFLEQFEDQTYRTHIVLDGLIYEVDCQDVDVDEDIFNATKNADGTIDFEVRFYNGGGSFNEAIESAMGKL